MKIKALPMDADNGSKLLTPFQELVRDMKNPCYSYAFAIGIPNYIKKKMKIDIISVGTHEDFEQYEAWLKENHPYMYWFDEIFMDKVQDVFCYIPKLYREIRWSLKNRFITKPHYLRTGFKPGDYHEIDERMLHGLFNTLQIYIEKELAHYANIFYNEEIKKERKDWTNVQHALAYLQWEIDDTSSEQSSAAKEKLELYRWWTEVYPTRIDPYDLVVNEEGHHPFTPSNMSYEEKYGAYNAESLRQIQEDEDMMIRLIKIRGSLWT
jgi:hypothetical protein